MDETISKNELYSLPYQQRSRLKWNMHLLYIFFIALFGGFQLLPVEGIQGLLFHLLGAALILCFLVMWIYTGVLKKSCVKISEEEICINTVFGTKKVLWEDVTAIQTYVIQRNAGIGVVTKQLQEKLKTKGDLYKLFHGRFALVVTINTFPDTNPEKLYATMSSLWQKALKSRPERDSQTEVESSSADETLSEERNTHTLLRAFFVSLAFGVIYGVSIYILHKNYFVIPFLGVFFIMLVYLKKKDSNTLPSRLILGLLCAFQVLVGLLIYLMIALGKENPSLGLFKIVSLSLSEMTHHVSDFLVSYITAGVLFLAGALCGVSFKFTRRIKKHFIRQENGYFLEKNKRFVSIYLVDYAEYDRKAGKYAVLFAPNTCLIEQQHHKLLAFYLPVEVMDKNQLYCGNLLKMQYNDHTYYKIDLGGSGEPRPYGYDCVLILNQDRLPELIKLDID